MRTATRLIGAESEEEMRSTEYVSRADRRKALGLVWIDCPYPVVSMGLEEVLADHARLHTGSTPPEDGTPSLVVFCPFEAEDIGAGIEGFRKTAPDTPVLVFALRIDLRAGRAALQAGACGLIHAAMQPAQIVDAISLAHAGEVVLPGDLLKNLMTEETVGTVQAPLTSRQQEILALVAEGLTNAQIARRLYLSEFTIKQHLRHAYKLLGVRNRTEAAKLFRNRQDL